MNPIIEELRREAKFSLAPKHVVRLLLIAAEAVESAEHKRDHALELCTVFEERAKRAEMAAPTPPSPS